MIFEYRIICSPLDRDEGGDVGDEGYEGNRGVQRRRRGRRKRGGGGGEEEGKCVTIAGQQTNEQTRKDRATQSMDG